jgi:hypothetical protein
VTQSDERAQHLFVVRIWYESGETSLGSWRGSVEHVPSGQRLYFASFSDLNDFIVFRSSATLTERQNPRADESDQSVSNEMIEE